MVHNKKYVKVSLINLILLTSFASFCAVIISPALPDISDHFDISNALTKQAITIFLLGYSLGQLIYPAFSNTFGRKFSLYLGISIFIIAVLVSFVSIWLHNFHVLLISRFLMALGSTVGMNISFTMIHDLYTPKEARKKTSYAVLSFSFMPALAMALGGILTTHLGWKYCFYIMLPYSLFILIISYLLPETLTQEKQTKFNLQNILTGYWYSLKNKYLILFSLIFGLGATIIYLIATESPFIAIDTLGLSEQKYGLYLLFGYVGQFFGAWFSGAIIEKLNGFKVMTLGIIIALVGTVIMLVLFLLNIINTYSLIMPLFLIMMGSPMIYSNASVYGIAKHHDKANAASVLNCIGMSFCVIGVFIISVIASHNSLMLPLSILTVYFFIIIIYFIAYKIYNKN